jgi:hypothetical protein
MPGRCRDAGGGDMANPYSYRENYFSLSLSPTTTNLIYLPSLCISPMMTTTTTMTMTRENYFSLPLPLSRRRRPLSPLCPSPPRTDDDDQLLPPLMLTRPDSLSLSSFLSADSDDNYSPLSLSSFLSADSDDNYSPLSLSFSLPTTTTTTSLSLPDPTTTSCYRR